MNDVLTANGFEIERGVPRNKLNDYIKAGNLVYAGLQFNPPDGKVTHNTLITGITSDGQYIFNDPYYGANTTLPGVKWKMIGYEVIIPPGI